MRTHHCAPLAILLLVVGAAGTPAFSQPVPVDPPKEDKTAATEKKRHSLTGDIRAHRNFTSKFLSGSRTFHVYLPPGYGAAENARRRYPALYLQDGQNVFDGATSFIPGQEWHVDETAETLIKAGLIEPLIIVAIENGGAERINEYTPTYRADVMGGAGGKGDKYGDFLIGELKPFIDATYRTRPDAENTGIGGSSLGALISINLALKRPDIFHRVAVVSPSVWWDEKYIVRQVRGLTEKPPFRVWLDIGSEEGYQSLPEARLLRDALISEGWRLNRDLSYREAEGMGHNEAAWALRVEPILRFLYPPRK